MGWTWQDSADMNANQDLLPWKKVIQDAVARTNVPQGVNSPDVGASAIPPRPASPNLSGEHMGPLMDTIRALQDYAGKNLGGRGPTAAQGRALGTAADIMGRLQGQSMALPADVFRTEAGMNISEANVRSQNRGQDLSYMLGMNKVGAEDKLGVLGLLMKAAGLEQEGPLNAAKAKYYGAHSTPTPFNSAFGENQATWVADQNAPGGYRMISYGTGPKGAGTENSLIGHIMPGIIGQIGKIYADEMIPAEQKAARIREMMQGVNEMFPGVLPGYRPPAAGPASAATTPSGKPKPDYNTWVNEINRNNPNQFSESQLRGYYQSIYGAIPAM